MSFWNYVFDSEWSQRSDIEALKERSRRQAINASKREHKRSNDLAGLKEQVDDLTEQVGSLELINRTLLALLRAKPDWSEQAFYETLQKIDLEDGKQDGKVTT